MFRGLVDSPLARASVLSVGLRFLGIGATFLMHLLLARSLDAALVGRFLVMLAAVNIAAVLCRMGHDTALVRFVASSMATDDVDLARSAYRIALVRTALASAGAAFVLGFSALLWDDADSVAALIMACAVPGACLAVVNSEALRGLRLFRYALFLHPLCIPALTSLGLIIAFPAETIVTAAIVYCASASAAALIGLVLCARAMSARLQGSTSAERRTFDQQLLWRTSLPLMWVSSLGMVGSWMGTLLLSFLDGSDEEVARFSMAAKAAQLAAVVLMAINTIIAPRFAAFHAIGDYWRLQRVAVAATAATVLFSLPYLLLLIFAPSFVMGVFGPQYVQAAGLLPILAFGQLVNTATGPVGQVLSMCGHERLVMRSVTIGILVNFLIATAAIPSLGAMGAALGAAAGLCIQNLLAFQYTRSRTGINPIAWSALGKRSR